MPTQRITLTITQTLAGIEATIAQAVLHHADGSEEELFSDKDIGVPASGVSWVRHVADEIRSFCPRIAAEGQLVHISADWSVPPTYIYDWVRD